MKNFILASITALVLTSLIVCSGDHTQTASTQSASMQTDSKSMQPVR